MTYGYDGANLVVKYADAEGKPRRITRLTYDDGGNVLTEEVRAVDGSLLARTVSARAKLKTPVRVVLSAGGAYQSDTRLVDATVGAQILRQPRKGVDPIEFALTGAYRFNSARGTTTADQFRSRLGLDYVYLLPRTSFFTFLAIERNIPANLKLNLESGILGARFDFLAGGSYKLDLSFAPVWNFRAILSPGPSVAGADPVLVDSSRSNLRGSLRLRGGYKSAPFSLLDTVEFLPVLYGDPIPGISGVWDRAFFRNSVTVAFDLSKRFTLSQDVNYTRDLSMRTQGKCPDAGNPICLGYAVATLTSVSVHLDIGE